LKALLSFGYKTFVADRLKAFTLDELHAFVSRPNVAATVEPLDDVSERAAGRVYPGVAGQGELTLASDPPATHSYWQPVRTNMRPMG
jgi:hypothetical protein